MGKGMNKKEADCVFYNLILKVTYHPFHSAAQTHPGKIWEVGMTWDVNTRK